MRHMAATSGSSSVEPTAPTEIAAKRPAIAPVAPADEGGEPLDVVFGTRIEGGDRSRRGLRRHPHRRVVVGCPLARLIGEVGGRHEVAGGDRRPAPGRQYGHPTVVVADRCELRRGLFQVLVRQTDRRGVGVTHRPDRREPSRAWSGHRSARPLRRTVAQRSRHRPDGPAVRRGGSATAGCGSRGRPVEIARGAPRTCATAPSRSPRASATPASIPRLSNTMNCSPSASNAAAEARADASAPSRSPIGARCAAVKKS